MRGRTVGLLHRDSSGHAGRQWLQQQAQDPFVVEARRQGYIARSAFKLTHLDDRFSLFEKNRTRAVVDLGCSPGGWCQVIRQRCGDACLIVGLDLLPMKATVPNAVFVRGDFMNVDVQQTLLEKLGAHQLRLDESRGMRTQVNGSDGKPMNGHIGGCVDVVTSDMCPNRSGSTQDRQRIAALDQLALAFAVPLLKPGGHFVCKVLGSRPSYAELHQQLCLQFLRVYTCKPPASRQHSDECFLVGQSKLEESRRGAVNARGRSFLYSTSEGGGSYGLDDWPGFARTRGQRGEEDQQSGRCGGSGASGACRSSTRTRCHRPQRS